MPSYPTSVKSFTTKNTGDTIQAAHVNDIQDEVNAVEAGLLNGTAPLNSSKSTVATLSVTGNSTLAALQAGASTFTVRPVTPPPECALVFSESTFAVGSSVLSTLVFNGEAFVQNSSMHSTGTNPERLTPQSTGWYQFALQEYVIGPTATASIFEADILDSSGIAIAIARVERSTQAGYALNLCGYKRYDVLGGYAIARYVATGTSTASLSSGVNGTWFAMQKL